MCGTAEQDIGDWAGRMAEARVGKRSTVMVVQSFRAHSIPDWIARCLSSVRGWASLHSYDYALWGDEVYDLCGSDYLATGFRNPQAMTNLARLLLMKRYLAEGYEAVVWLDADVFIFAPKSFRLNFSPDQLAVGYAFGLEVWLDEDRRFTVPRAHNALTYFTRDQKDLDLLINIITHIGRRGIKHNFQVGVRLLRGLHYSLRFTLLPHVAMYSPTLIAAICEQEQGLLQMYGRAFGFPSQAANLCLSETLEKGHARHQHVMDLLEESEGAVINRFARQPS